ncbi:type II toxin-antitoxin system HipA family toxin [Agrobacterium tumefaciens]|uniref:Type II toxin-antitoxin system HipA family toxin n=1 Tax=Agrobacterium tumefaciens TaxID=358 RepID=A0A4D7YQ25_AGRTU|nr:type II toxin-antitoxin system HipA family toxin [Agrobacterium tumefaciens]QCL97837.1 type II toxin-antitoxin system HipA family toxin [Agrobacterium tumefaciens]
MLHLVGLNIDRHRAHAGAEAGTLVHVARGVYVDATDDINRVIIEHAVRIAAYFYDQAYLSGPSSMTGAPTEDGRLFLSGRRNQRTRIRSLEIIQNQAPDSPSTVPIIVGDSLGEITRTASSPRQRFLEAFRRRSEHAGAIDPAMRRQMAERLLEEFGSAAAAADALWAIARPNRWTAEAEAAERYLIDDIGDGPATLNRAALDLIVAWHGNRIGHLTHDGAEWRWIPEPGRRPPLIRPSRPGSLPPFVESLMPEGWLAEVLNGKDEREVLRSGRRYMSNMAIVGNAEDLETIPPDVLEGRLSNFQAEGLFTGQYKGPKQREFDDTFQQKIARLFSSAATPRLSGVQIKAPMCLRENGELLPATDEAFTHILKPAGTAGFEMLPIVEWLGLSLARAVGFDVPEAALIPMPKGVPPALLVERFDIRRSKNDSRLFAMEDFCSILELPAERKYEGTIERMARGLRPLSTSPEDDIRILFQRALYAWFIADGDMHLKNLALLKIAEEDGSHFTSVRFAPVYDAVTTRVFPRLEHDRMALKLNGRDDRLSPDDFEILARTIELPARVAAETMTMTARAISNAIGTLVLPESYRLQGDRVLDRIREIASARVAPFI